VKRPRVGVAPAIVLLASTICTLAPAEVMSPSRPITFRAPAGGERAELRRILGNDFVTGNGGPMQPRLLVAKSDVSAKHYPALIATQRAQCSNHSCDYAIVIKEPVGYQLVDTINSWGSLYVLPHMTSGMHDFVAFDHVTDDCEACTPAQPVVLRWDPKSKNDDGTFGAYEEKETLKGKAGKPYCKRLLRSGWWDDCR
jgi:hypothetical protein